MPNFNMMPQQMTLLALATQTTSGTSAVITNFPPASSYRIIVEVQTVSGTTPTLVVALATTCNSGTTFNEILTTTTMTTSGQGNQLLIRPYLGIGDAATQVATSLLGTADLAAGVVNNGPIAYLSGIKLRWIISGTLPSFAFQVLVVSVPQDLAD